MASAPTIALANTATDLLFEQPNVQLRYSIAGASSYTGTYEPHHILYDRPLELKSRWTAAYVRHAPDASQAASTSSATGAGSDQLAQASSSTQPNAGGTPQLNRELGANGNFLSSYASAVPTTGARPRSPLPSTRRSPGVQPALTPTGGTQYLLLKLDKLSIVRRIHFGKFHRSHACNLKDLIVYASPTVRDPGSHAWIPILRCGLKNDNIAEAFKTQYATSDGVPFPTRYLKIVPLATHQPNFNFSIWHVALEGVSEHEVVRRILAEYQEHRESTSLRMMLKHLRSRAYHSAFRILLESSRLDAPLDHNAARSSTPKSSSRRPFEHPIVTRLFHALMQGQWDVAEACLEQAAWGEVQPPLSSPDLGDSVEALGAQRETEPSASITAASSLLISYIERSVPNPVWTPIVATNEDGEMPCGRAGHQMELDAEKGIIWLFGGWDGTRDLNDLWAYYIREGRWRCVSSDTRRQGGPTPRSCHAMVFDPRTGFLYVLGRFVETERPQTQQQSTQPLRSSSSPSAGPNSTREQQPAASGTGRGLLVPRLAGTSATESSYSSTTQRGADGHDQLFASGRGGSMRLGQGGSGGSGETPRDTLTTGTQTPPMHDTSPSSHRTSSSPRQGNTSSSRHPWRYAQPGFESDFYRFSTRSERWDRLSFDTCAEGGPKLLGDPQMVIDSETQLLYVFGGHEYTNEVTLPTLSGMWKYDVIQRSWTFLFDDHSDPESRIPARAGHIMLLDTPRRGSLAGKRTLWIMAGKRGSSYMADMWTYQPNTGAVRQVCSDYHLLGGPEGGFTQRATINSDAREITLFSGLVQSKNRSETEAKSAFWTYHLERNEWRLVCENGGLNSATRRGESGSDDGGNGGGTTEADDNSDMVIEPGEPSAFPVISNLHSDIEAGFGAERSHSGTPMPFGATDAEPRPRFASQMVHDPKSKLYYIFGGNPIGKGTSMRLGDLWSLELARPSIGEVLRKVKFRLRQQRFLEMTKEGDAMEALMYLQTRVAETVNHEVPEESQGFRKLMAHLLHGSIASASVGYSPSDVNLSHSDAVVKSDEGQDATLESPAWLGTRSPLSLSATEAHVNTTSEEKTSHVGGSSVGSEGDSEMLTVSQVLSPSGAAAVAGVTAGSSTGGSGTFFETTATEGRPTPLYNQRYRLFRSLCEFFPPEDTEPESDLLECIDASKIPFSSIPLF